MSTEETPNAWHSGFEHGNYAAAYETADFGQVRVKAGLAPLDATYYKHGMLLGFYSSYEIHEIPEEYQDRVATLRTRYAGEL